MPLKVPQQYCKWAQYPGPSTKSTAGWLFPQSCCPPRPVQGPTQKCTCQEYTSPHAGFLLRAHLLLTWPGHEWIFTRSLSQLNESDCTKVQPQESKLRSGNDKDSFLYNGKEKVKLVSQVDKTLVQVPSSGSVMITHWWRHWLKRLSHTSDFSISKSALKLQSSCTPELLVSDSWTWTVCSDREG